MNTALRDHYIVCGMGHVGYRIALLLRRLGQSVAVIYDHAPEEWLREAGRAGVVCFQGDAQNDRQLMEAGIEHARGIIGATDQDMVNLSVALDSARLNPRTAIIVRLFDQELGRYLQDSLQTRRVLSASALAAPAFVAAALGQETLGCFSAGKHHFTVVAAHTANGAAEAIEELLPLFQAAGDHVERAAGIVKNAQPAHLLAILPAHKSAGARANRSWFVRGIAAAVTGLRQVPIGVHIVVAAVVFLMLAGILAVHSTMSLSFLDALYFVVTTITTTGYGDVSFLNAPNWVKLFGCFLMISGASLLALLFGIITDAIISRRFRNVFKNFPVATTNHIIVAGSGHVAYRVIEEIIREGHDVVAISSNGEDSTALQAVGVPIIEGDPRMAGVLQLAGIDSAMAVIALHEKDVVSLGVGLLAKKLNPAVRTVVRVFDGDLAGKLQQQLAVDCVMSLSAVSAPAFVAACLYENVVQAMVWQDCLLVLRTTPAAGGAPVQADLSVKLRLDPASGALVIADGSEEMTDTRVFYMSLHRLKAL